MGIEEIIFFTSPGSANAQNVGMLLYQNKIPHTTFNILSKQTKELLSNKGKFYSVKSVPTFLVRYNGNKLRKYEGLECIDFINLIIKESSTPEINETNGVSTKVNKTTSSGASNVGVKNEEVELIESEDENELNKENNHQSLQPKIGESKIDVASIAQQAEQERSDLESMNNKNKRNVE